MQEPVWEKVYEQYPQFEGRLPKKGDLVYVTGKTRGRFGALDVAPPGAYGLVIASWSSSMGTPKITILQEDGTEVATTGSCARVWGNFHITGARDEGWYEIWLNWMDATYIPVIVQREKGFRKPWATSRDGKSVLVKPLAGHAASHNGKLWLGQAQVHPDDWRSMSESSESCVSVRIPVWLAKKAGVFGVV